MLRAKNRLTTILLMNEDDFKMNHTSELLAHLEDIPGFKRDGVLNFPTNIRIGGGENIQVLNAFNMYLQQLSRDTDRIIIKLNKHE